MKKKRTRGQDAKVKSNEDSICRVMFDQSPHTLGLKPGSLFSLCPQNAVQEQLGISHRALLTPMPGTTLIDQRDTKDPGSCSSYRTSDGVEGRIAFPYTWNALPVPRNDGPCTVWDKSQSARVSIRPLNSSKMKNKIHITGRVRLDGRSLCLNECDHHWYTLDDPWYDLRGMEPTFDLCQNSANTLVRHPMVVSQTSISPRGNERNCRDLLFGGRLLLTPQDIHASHLICAKRAKTNTAASCLVFANPLNYRALKHPKTGYVSNSTQISDFVSKQSCNQDLIKLYDRQQRDAVLDSWKLPILDKVSDLPDEILTQRSRNIKNDISRAFRNHPTKVKPSEILIQGHNKNVQYDDENGLGQIFDNWKTLFVASNVDGTADIRNFWEDNGRDLSLLQLLYLLFKMDCYEIGRRNQLLEPWEHAVQLNLSPVIGTIWRHRRLQCLLVSYVLALLSYNTKRKTSNFLKRYDPNPSFNEFYTLLQSSAKLLDGYFSLVKDSLSETLTGISQIVKKDHNTIWERFCNRYEAIQIEFAWNIKRENHIKAGTEQYIQLNPALIPLDRIALNEDDQEMLNDELISSLDSFEEHVVNKHGLSSLLLYVSILFELRRRSEITKLLKNPSDATNRQRQAIEGFRLHTMCQGVFPAQYFSRGRSFHNLDQS